MKKRLILTKKTYKVSLINKLVIFLIGAIALISVIAPYIHILLDRTSTVEVFGFHNMRAFLYAIGLPTSMFFISSYLLYITKHLKYKRQKRHTGIISFVFLWSSFFQFTWIFWDRQDLKEVIYYISILVLSIVTASVYYFIIAFRKSIIQSKSSLITKYKAVVLMLNTYIYKTEKDLKDEVKQEHSIKRGELVKKVLDNVG